MKQSWATEANNDKRLKSRKQKSKNDCEDKRAWYAKSIQKYNPEWKQTAYFEGLLDGKVVQLFRVKMRIKDGRTCNIYMSSNYDSTVLVQIQFS